MKKLFQINLILVAFWLLTTSSIAHSNEIEIPDIGIINQEANLVVTYLFGNSFSNIAVSPKQIILDFEKDKISGLIAIYDISAR